MEPDTFSSEGQKFNLSYISLYAQVINQTNPTMTTVDAFSRKVRDIFCDFFHNIFHDLSYLCSEVE